VGNDETVQQHHGVQGNGDTRLQGSADPELRNSPMVTSANRSRKDRPNALSTISQPQQQAIGGPMTGLQDTATAMSTIDGTTRRSIDRSQHRHGTMRKTFDNNKRRVSRTIQYKSYATRNLSTGVVVCSVQTQYMRTVRSIKAFQRTLFSHQS
jgi:ribosomal protein S17E